MAWGREVTVTANAVEVYIGYLRRKLDHLGAGDLLHTVRGRGYQLVLSPEPVHRGEPIARPQ
jgi:DNA-binding response OmpR family regulator